MLVLSRKPDQKIHIGDAIIITITAVKGDTVRVGIDAPSDLKIYREEILAKIARKLSGEQAVDVETGQLVEVIPATEPAAELIA